MDGWMKWMGEAPKPTPWDAISRDSFTKSKTITWMADPPPNYLLLYCCHLEYNKTKLLSYDQNPDLDQNWVLTTIENKSSLSPMIHE